MEPVPFCLLFISLVTIWSPLPLDSKVFMVVMEEDPVSSNQAEQEHPWVEQDIMVYKELIRKRHDLLLQSLVQDGSYNKLYSYSHLINGFAVDVASEEVLNALKTSKAVRAIHEDVKMEKLTTHTPDFLGIPTGVWPALGGASSSGEGVVIGLIDTGINPHHPSFMDQPPEGTRGSKVPGNGNKFQGKCLTGNLFPQTACNGKVAGARLFARAAIASGDFNATRDYASPFDADGHGSHTASTAAGNHQVPVIVNGFNYGYASGMAPGARISVYKAVYSFGGYMSDVVAAVEQAVEDGVDILSLSIGPASIPSGPSAFLNVLEMELLFAVKAGVLVVQAAGNGGPSSSSILSFSPWITSVAASVTDRKYLSLIELGNGQSFTGIGLAPPTAGGALVPVVSAADIYKGNMSAGIVAVESCQHTESFIPFLAKGKLIICTYNLDFELEAASIAVVADTIQKIGAAGFIITLDPNIGPRQAMKGTTVTLQVPGIVLGNLRASSALWEYYNSNTIRNSRGRAVGFAARARILDGRRATYNGQAPQVASYSSRGPDVNNALLQTADILKPNIMAPGSLIWAAWSPQSEGDKNIKGQQFALVSGTSMATPHVAGVAALIKQKHPTWSPSAIVSAIMTTADVTDHSGSPILAQQANRLFPASPFDYGAGSINPTRAIDPGLVFDTNFWHYVEFLCAVPGVDGESVRRAVGVGCAATAGERWCSDLNTPSVTVSSLVGRRKVVRRVTNVGDKAEVYRVAVREPAGVAVGVWPRVFQVEVNASRLISVKLEATEATDAYTFGEMVLSGSREHVVRVPIAVYVSSVLKS